MTTIYILIQYDATNSRFAWRELKTDTVAFTPLGPIGPTGSDAPDIVLSGYKSGTFAFLKDPASTSTIRYAITPPDRTMESGELLPNAGPSVTLDITTTEEEVEVPIEFHRTGATPYIGHFKIKGDDGQPDLIDPSSRPGASWPSPLRPLLRGVENVSDAVAASFERGARGPESRAAERPADAGTTDEGEEPR
jgi:hypothetical protein